ncbi:LURP-one-related/scramblase family protein [Ileibacterium valens]|uniref:LURP-one-related/scramblase family protein n=1 Tax=Ileibacterium valens TaxID=1862668 RepID=UPI00272D7CDC|nr:LURP-one-related family protein [Ileibacterium valens]
MNTLYIAQKIFSLWGEYDVTNEQGQMVYHVKGVPSFLRKQLIFDASGAQVGEIKQQFSFLPEFNIYIHGRQVGTIKSRLSLFKTNLDLNYYHWNVVGNFFAWNYQVFSQSNREIATIGVELWHMSDHYYIRFDQEQDALPLLLLALAIDCIRDASQHSS